MIKLVGGPADGAYAVKRAPLYLRAVVNKSGGKDVLDQLIDEPSLGETVSVYKRKGEAGTVHVRFSGKSKNATGFYATAEYEHLPDVEGEPLRENAVWREWAKENG